MRPLTEFHTAFLDYWILMQNKYVTSKKKCRNELLTERVKFRRINGNPTITENICKSAQVGFSKVLSETLAKMVYSPNHFLGNFQKSKTIHLILFRPAY